LSTSPTQKTLTLFRDEGFQIEVVERWVPGANIRKDLFGFVDLVAIRDGVTYGIQATSTSNMSARQKKIADSDLLRPILEAEWTILVVGWSKINNRWRPRIVSCELSEDGLRWEVFSPSSAS
jgi:hypothetical protein